MSGSLYEKLRSVEKREWLALGAVAALVGVCFFFRLGGVPLLGKDEPRYAEVAREMVAAGDWVTPRLAGAAWFEKPALPYWLMAAGFELLGVTELAARLGSALLATLAVATVYLAARRAAGPERAAVAAAVLTTSALWFSFARGASFDMPLAGTMTAALGAFYGYDVAATAAARLRWAALFGAFAGASMLAKGLVGPLLLGLIVVAYALVTGAWRRARLLDPLVAAAAAAAVAATWYVPVWAANGWPFVEEFFVNHHFKRYVTNRYRHPQPVWFYPLVALGGLLPWTLLLVPGARRMSAVAWRRPATDDERLVVLAVVWAAVPLIFFSLSTSKLPGYIVPIFPALALLVAWSVERAGGGRAGRWAFAATAVVMAALGTGLAVYAARALDAPAWEVALLGAPLAAGGAAVALALARRGTRAAVWSVAAWSALAVVLIATLLFGELGRRESLKELSAAARGALGPGERVVLLGVVEYSPAFYAEGRMVVGDDGQILVADSVEQVATAAAPAASVLCVTDEAGAARLAGDGRLRVEPLAAERDRLLLRVTLEEAADRRR